MRRIDVDASEWRELPSDTPPEPVDTQESQSKTASRPQVIQALFRAGSTLPARGEVVSIGRRPDSAAAVFN